MAQSIRNIISEINQSLRATFTGSKFYGVAVSVERDGRVQPVANEAAVSFDDSYGVIGYHKLNGVQTKIVSSFGNLTNTINTFSVSLFIFNNEKITNLKTDEIAMIIQQRLSVLNISSTEISLANIILNTQAIFSSEYRGTSFPLGETTGLMQMNYNVEITFKSGCVDLCPEGFSSCKN